MNEICRLLWYVEIVLDLAGLGVLALISVPLELLNFETALDAVDNLFDKLAGNLFKILVYELGYTRTMIRMSVELHYNRKDVRYFMSKLDEWLK